jgi:hypothetical protein
MKRVIIAGLVAGIGMFLWSGLAHMALPLGEVGVSTIPNEEPLLATMMKSVGSSSGFYLFPDPGLGTSAERMERYEKKVASAPSGLLIYHPAGWDQNEGRLMAIEFATECIFAMIAIALLAWSGIQGYGRRVAFVAVIGLIAAAPVNLQYWNWYGFPAAYTIANIFTEATSFLVAGLIGAAMLRRKPAVLRAAA